MISRKASLLVLLAALTTATARGAISEPDHVFYGVVLDDGVAVTTGVVSVRINGDSVPAASYALGSLPVFGTKYVLRVPLSSGTPRIPGTAQQGDQAAFYLGTTLVGSTTVGERGSPQLVDLDVDFQGTPTLSVENVLAVEGDGGAALASFTISLNFAVISDVTVEYATSDGTAVAPDDYTTTSGTATIAAGQTGVTVDVPIVGNTLAEDNRAFTLTLSNPFRATIAQGVATATIVDDDAIPAISIGDASVQEGSAVSTFIHFPVTMTSVARTDVEVDYATTGITAAAGTQFVDTSGTLVIPAGSISATIDVEILPDGLPSGELTFSVTLTNPSGGTLDRDVATGTIVDADRLLSFVEMLGSPGIAGLSGAVDLVMSPGGEHLYTAAPLDDSIVVFARNPLTGKLAATQRVQNGVGGSSGIGGVRSLAISRDGRHVYAAGSTDGALAVYGRDGANGQLTFIELHKNGFSGTLGLRGVTDVAVTPSGTNVYAVSADEDSIAIFHRDDATGRLTFAGAQFQDLGGFDGLAGASSIAITRDASSVYVGSPRASAIALLRRDSLTGALTFGEVQKNGVGGVSGLLGLMPVALSVDDRQLYGGASLDSALGVFARDTGSGALTFVTRHVNGVDTADGLAGVAGVAATLDGRFVFAAGAADDALAVLSRDTVTGELRFREVEKNGISGANGLDGATAVAVSPDSKFVYVAAAAQNAITCFKIRAAAALADPDGDGSLNLDDVFYLSEFFFNGGPAPVGRADFNGDGQVTMADLFMLLRFLFAGGPTP